MSLRHRRRLSAREAEFVDAPQRTIGFAYTLRGALDAEALLRAFGRLREQHPLLAGRVVAVADGLDFVVDESAKAPREAMRLLTGEPGSRVLPDLDPDTCLASLDVVSYAEDWHCVIPWCNHAAADGRLWLFLIQRLWSLYTQEAQGVADRQLPEEAGAFPGTMEDLLEQRGVPRGTDTGEDRVRGARWSGARPTAGAVLASDFQLQSTRLRLDEDVTASLRALAARRGVSMHGVVAGALALAERAGFADVPPADVVPMAFISPVEMRARVSPPIRTDEVTNFMGTAYASAGVSCGSSLLDLGAALAEQLVSDLASGLVLGAMAVEPSADRGGVGVVLNNIGVIPVPELPEGLVAEDVAWRFFVEPGQMRSSLEAMPQEAEIPMDVGSIYYFYSFQGMLHIDLMHMPGCASDQERESLLDRVAQLLAQTAQAEEAP